MTATNIANAVSALADRQFSKRLDCDVVLVNIMCSVSELVFDRNLKLPLPLGEKAALLLLMERRSRSTHSSPGFRRLCSKVRRHMFATVQSSIAAQAETRKYVKYPTPSD